MAAHACLDKKATDLSILQLDPQASGFTDYFIVCSGANPRQVQAVADEVDLKLSGRGSEPSHKEGYDQADWVLLDYVDFVVHIFSESARKFYDLERLWKAATRLQLEDLEKPVRKATSKKTPTAVKATKSTKTAAKSAAKKTGARKRASARHMGKGS